MKNIPSIKNMITILIAGLLCQVALAGPMHEAVFGKEFKNLTGYVAITKDRCVTSLVKEEKQKLVNPLRYLKVVKTSWLKEDVQTYLDGVRSNLGEDSVFHGSYKRCDIHPIVKTNGGTRALTPYFSLKLNKEADSPAMVLNAARIHGKTIDYVVSPEEDVVKKVYNALRVHDNAKVVFDNFSELYMRMETK